MKEETIIRISVRSLVEFILREGDIDNRVSGSMEKDAMLLGGKIHRKIQSRMGTNYTAEVPLKIQMPCDGFVLQIEGRADGVLKDDGKVLIDEIKGILRSLEHLEAPVPVHLAQAKCYAYIYAVQNSLKCIDVQMTYCQMETEEIRRFCQKFEFQELQTWFQDLVTQYEKWAKFEIEWRNVRNDSIRQIEFPFPIEKDSATWWSRYTARSCERKSCLSRRLPEWEKQWQLYFRQCGQWGKGWEKRFFI